VVAQQADGSASGASALTPRGQKTRAALVRSARKLFERRGYLETTVAEITKRAGVAHGTFYTYFDSKEEIFSEAVDDMIRDFQATARAQPLVHEGIAGRIERANRGYLRAYRRNAAMMAILEQVATFNAELREVRRAARRQWVDRSVAAFTAWREMGLVAPSIDPYYAASCLGSMVDRSAYVWLVLGEPYDEDLATVQLTELYCRALGITPPSPETAIAAISTPKRRQTATHNA
jgi:AcrR family transcriptional regulator